MNRESRQTLAPIVVLLVLAVIVAILWVFGLMFASWASVLR